MKVVPCTTERLLQIEPMTGGAEDATNVHEWYDDASMAALSKAILNDSGRAIAAMGVIPVFPRVATAWALLSEESVSKHGPLLHIVARRGLNKAMATGQFTRIDMLVEQDFAAAVEWAKRLGFERESTRRNYGADGRTTFDEYVIYVEAPAEMMESA